MRITARDKAIPQAALFGVSMLLALLVVVPFVLYAQSEGDASGEASVEDAVVTEDADDAADAEAPTDDDVLVVDPDADLETTNKKPPIPEGDDAFMKETEQFSVSPVVTNEKVKPRDIIKKELVVTNHLDRRVDLYITVENIDATEGSQETVSPAVADLSKSLANWVEITRGVIELGPKESRKIPYLIHVNLSAVPGNYLARVQFREGSRRDYAESKDEGASLLLNVEVLDDANERLQLSGFVSEDSLVLGDTVSFSYLLENIGNRLVEPRGSIRIFNRRGEEVGSVPLNADGEEINPENKRQLAAAWSAAGRFGKYKAFLDLEYGENQLASVQDTVYFWVFPWKEILASLAGVFVLAIIGTYIVHMRAMAQPIPVRSRSASPMPEADDQEPFQPERPVSNFPIPTSARPTTQPRAASPAASVSPQQGQTVLLGSRKNTTAPPPSSPATPTQQGATVELAGRSAAPRSQARPQTYGSTVQLQRRQ
jgi:hypothetical protein